MTEINFGSTYRIPITHAGINAAKKEKLRCLVLSYPNSLISKNKTGYARVSMPNDQDADFIRRLKGIGYKVFQKFEGENINSSDLDVFIKRKLDTRDFQQKGKNPPKFPRKLREKRRFERSFNDEPPTFAEKSEYVECKANEILTPDKIRQSESYKLMAEAYGKEVAEEFFFDPALRR